MGEIFLNSTDQFYLCTNRGRVIKQEFKSLRSQHRA